ncbi:hypothetical protein [Beggiatoa leptomitoformis]|uniref:Uncharacterized protein n=1 Tax=Beggiatoa leptomitoformis TaxID=288004 RepID=A0A2N9YBD2_9GAMM|nr:hypothetical protein [Beggiatoa leptomitoformis]ALG66872.1 hypothetical protein AL038_03000 [Beggiatoa leptomitoformis]AUI67773.1 hypothetical protein BLE401_03040 [Beggiatoa leptomitoformis]
MKPNAEQLKKLLQTFLATQTDITDTSRFTDEQLIAVITGKKQFTKEEQKVLFTSPATRYRLIQLQQLQRLKAYMEWEQYQVQPALIVTKAATTALVKREDIETNTHTLSLIPHDIAGTSWSIVLELKSDCLKRTYGVKLVDQHGDIWLKGYPDNNGIIETFWQRQESPLALLKEVELKLEPL